MIAPLLQTEPNPPLPKTGDAFPVEILNFDKGDLSRARAICKWAPEWIEEILDGGRGHTSHVNLKFVA
jgi:hypothetical protein